MIRFYVVKSKHLRLNNLNINATFNIWIDAHHFKIIICDLSDTLI